ncbi:MAG: MFS transporter [Halomonas sp.]|nr:MFS transporter [Halomonas sp.]|tara:strand:+ start:1206 stop:2480 length:1275 start_codon:yes stop_codon:yes gene_type:complete
MVHSAATTPAPGSAQGIEDSTGVRRWLVPLALLACVVLSFFDKISIAVLISTPAFQADLGLTGEATKLGMLMTGFLLSYGASSMFLGFLGDIFSPKSCLYAMLFMTAALMAVMGFVDDYGVLLGLRILLGIAEGPLFAVAYTIVKRLFPPREQARATMLWLLGTPIGATLGFPFTIWVVDQFGWRTSFFAIALLTIPVVLIVYLVFRKLDVTTRSPALQQTDRSHVPLSTHRAATAKLLKRWSFWSICLFNVAFLAYLWGLNSWLPTYLVQDKGINLDQAGVFSSLPFIAMLVGEVIGAFASDRFDRRALLCSISLLGAGLGLWLVLSIDGSNWAMIAAMSFSAAMWGFGAPNVFALLAKATSSDVSATAGGIFNGLGNFSGALVPVLIGALIAATGNMTAGLMFMMVMAFLGASVLIPLIRRY